MGDDDDDGSHELLIGLITLCKLVGGVHLAPDKQKYILKSTTPAMIGQSFAGS